MREYMPLLSSPPLDDPTEDGPKSPRPPQTISSRRLTLFSTLIALLAIASAAAFHLSVLSATYGVEPLLSPSEIESNLRMARPSPNLEKGHDTMKEKKFKFPRMVFPMLFVRANAAEPERLYRAGSSVVLSPSDSMIYHWRSNSSWPKCYLTAWVSSAEDLIAGNKSYSAAGDVTALEIWNVSTPANPSSLKTMSWNTRPARIALLGTVNFTSRALQNRLHYLDAQELKDPTPRFDCLGDTEITVEVTCKECQLRFEQIFSMPPLGFELMQLA